MCSFWKLFLKKKLDHFGQQGMIDWNMSRWEYDMDSQKDRRCCQAEDRQIQKFSTHGQKYSTFIPVPTGAFCGPGLLCPTPSVGNHFSLFQPLPDLISCVWHSLFKWRLAIHLLYIYMYAFSKHFYPKRLTEEDYHYQACWVLLGWRQYLTASKFILWFSAVFRLVTSFRQHKFPATCDCCCLSMSI